MTHYPFQEDLEIYSFLDNTAWDYTLALVRLIVFTFVIIIFKFVLLRRLNTWVDAQDRLDRIEHIPEAVDGLITLKFSGLIAFYLSTLDLDFPSSIRFFLDFVVLFIIFRFILKFFYVVVDNVSQYQVDKEPTSRHIIEFFKLIVKFILFLFVGLWFLSIININITAYLAGLSVLGLALAFALQNVIADMFSTVVLYFDKPFEIGDSVKVGSHSGVVEQIGIRSTHIRLGSGTLLIISNRELMNKRIENTKNRTQRKISLKLGVSADTSVNKLKSIPKNIEKIINSVDNTRFARAHFVNIGDYSLDFEIVYYITNPSYTDYLVAQDSVNFQILENFEKDGISMPFPTQTVIVEQQNKE